MRRLALCLLLLVLLVLPGLPLLAQQAPDAINRALDDLSGRLASNIRLSDLDNWTFAQELYPDASLGCAQPGQTYAQVLTDGYRFSLTYRGITADYRVSADQRFTILCNAEAIIELARPGCPPADDPAYLPARLRVGAQGRVTAGGLPNNIRSIPGTSGGFVGEIPPGQTFTVLDGPECSQVDKLVWWQVDYQGLVGWTASGQNGQYWLEPLDGPAAPGAVAITAANALMVNSLPLAHSALSAAALSRDASKYAIGDALGVTVLFLADPNGARLTLDRNTVPVTEPAIALAFESTGNRLAAGYPEGYLALISTAPGDAITVMWGARTEGVAVHAVAFSPDDTLIVSGGADGRVTLWDSRSGQSVAVLVGHAGPVVRLEFSADGSTLLSQDDRGIVLLWQVAGAETVDVG
jgi:hypothetical protein